MSGQRAKSTSAHHGFGSILAKKPFAYAARLGKNSALRVHRTAAERGRQRAQIACFPSLSNLSAAKPILRNWTGSDALAAGEVHQAFGQMPVLQCFRAFGTKAILGKRSAARIHGQT